MDPNTLLALLDSLPFRVEYADDGMVGRFYNRASYDSGKRTPGDLGRHLLDCHRAESSKTIQGMYDEFRAGRREPFVKKRDHKGRLMVVIWSPVVADGEFRGVSEVLLYPEEM